MKEEFAGVSDGMIKGNRNNLINNLKDIKG